MNYLGLVQNLTAIILQGSSVVVPYKGARIFREASVKPEAETIVEELHITLEGTAAQIETAIRDLSRWCLKVKEAKFLPEADRVFLQAQVIAAGTMWRSLLIRAELAVVGQGPGQRGVGVQGIRLTVERLNYWEDSTEQTLYLASQATGRTQAGVSLYNCWDGTRSNYVHLNVGDTDGDLPAPVRLSYSIPSLAANGSLYVGQNINSDPSGLQPCLQGETGAAAAPSTLTGTAHASASNGNFGRFAWTGTGVAVLGWTLSTAVLQSMGGGRSFRLFNSPTRSLPVKSSGRSSGRFITWGGTGIF